MKNLVKNFVLLFSTFLVEKIIVFGKISCYEYSCEECETPEYGKCTKCRESFKLIDGTCPCMDGNCALCTSGYAGAECEQCKSGNFNFFGKCYTIINYCERPSNNRCLKCITNYYYDEKIKKCVENPEKIKCNDTNCETCFSSEKGACEECKKGYTLKKGECLLLPTPDINNSCPENYYYEKGGCHEICEGIECNEKEVDYFGDYYSCPSNECLLCIDNQIYLWSNCDNSKDCKIEGCLNCLTSDECGICAQGYYLISGLCKRCMNGCSSCSNSTSCNYCLSGFELSDNGLCQKTNIMDFNTEYYSQNKKILILIYYPEEIESSSRKDNNPSFSLDNSIISKNSFSSKESNSLNSFSSNSYNLPENNSFSSISSISPSNPYQNVSYSIEENKERTEIFHPCDKNCLKCYDDNGTCLECQEDYKLVNNVCELECGENCLSCSMIGPIIYCTRCMEGFKRINSDSCTRICDDYHCSSCPYDSSKCLSAEQGYFVKDFKVYKCFNEYCNTCLNEEESSCTSCKLNYELSNGKCGYSGLRCLSSIDECKLCYDSSVCLECKPNCKLTSNNKGCKCKSKALPVVLGILGTLLVIIGIIILVICTNKRDNQNIMDNLRIAENYERGQNNNQNNENRRYRRGSTTRNNESSVRNIAPLNKKSLLNEFEYQKLKNVKKQMCQYCHCKQGLYNSDCGCILCKGHSKQKIVDGDGEKYKICYVCSKVVKKVSLRKYPCQICMQDKPTLVHFKCGCALEVCKDCYVKCKMTSKKCPACRAII